MARINSVISFTGKLGEIVGMKGKGATFLRRHNAPSNPNTARQLDQRLKFALGVKLANITPEMAYYKLGSNKVERRGALVSQVIKNASIENVAGTTPSDISLGFGLDARVAYNKLQFSRGPQLVTSARSTIEDGTMLIVRYTRGDLNAYYFLIFSYISRTFSDGSKDIVSQYDFYRQASGEVYNIELTPSLTGLGSTLSTFECDTFVIPMTYDEDHNTEIRNPEGVLDNNVSYANISRVGGVNLSDLVYGQSIYAGRASRVNG